VGDGDRGYINLVLLVGQRTCELIGDLRGFLDSKGVTETLWLWPLLGNLEEKRWKNF